MNYSRDQLVKMGMAVGKDVTVHKTVQVFGAKHIRIGSHVRIDAFSVLSGGPRGLAIGSHVHISTSVAVLGNAASVLLDDFCGLASRVVLLSATDDFKDGWLTGPTVPSELRKVTRAAIHIGRHAVVGVGSVVMPGVTIGDGATIGALSLVRRDVEPFIVAAGNPLRLIGQRDRGRLLELERLLARRETRGE